MPVLSRIAPEVPVTDLNAAIDYYCQRLGFELAAKLNGGDYAIVERDGVAIHLFQQNSESFVPIGLHIFAHDLESLHAELCSRGATICQDIARKSWGNREFRVNDSTGNILKFTEPIAAD